MTDFIIGDLVKTPHNDQKMIVHKVYFTEVICIWFVDATLIEETFSKFSLIKINKT